MSRLIWLVIVVGGLSLAPIESSGGTAEEPPPVGSFPSPTLAPLTKIGIAIGGVSLLGLGFTVWGRRRWRGTGGDATRISVIASRALGARHQIALIDIGGRRILIGMGGDSITTLADLSEEASFSAELESQIPPQPANNREELVGMIGAFEGLDA